MGWRARLRRWLWLDGNNVRTDHSRADRGFYVGGQPVTRRFILPVVALGVVIAMIILFTRGAAADGTTAHEQQLLLEPASLVTGAWEGQGPVDGLGRRRWWSASLRPAQGPESIDDIASDRPIIGCLLVLAILVFISVVLFVVGVTI